MNAEQFKKQIQDKLKKINQKQAEIEKFIDDIDGIVSKVDKVEEKTKINYGTSCVRMEKNGKLLTEY